MITVFTDGAYSPKQKQGGWSYIIINNNHITINFQGDNSFNVTNNRMEIEAVLRALEALKNFNEEIIIYTDSMYVVGSLTLNWARNKNLDLWDKFQQYDLSRITFKHIKGHANNLYNNLCDMLAVFCTKTLIL